MEHGYESLFKAKKEAELKRKQKYKLDSKERLKKIARKKIQTTMIGALDTIEKHLGFLWEDDSSQSQSLKQIYETVRQEILDRGNDQIRNLDTELNQYDVEWLRYTLTLPVKRRDQEND
ncbi:MAG: hypothetical protein KKH44_01320 [Bacteroidetes bacterium]|nr:hypothetical protein [Bacteroidota bacterium]